MDTSQIATLAGIVALRACGHPGRSADAPAPIAAYALAFSAAVVGLAVAAQASSGTDWTGAPAEQIAQALYSIARDGLIPGGQADPSATGYIFKAKGGAAPTGRPSPRGRLAMARAAGYDVRVVTVGKGDSLTLDDSGDVDNLCLDPDARPANWADLRGIILHVDDIHTGARRSLWIARADLAERKAKAAQKSGWDTDAIGMACIKAVSIAVARGAIPQASLIPAILAACSAHPTPARAIAIEAPARQLAAPAPPEPEPEQAPPAEPERAQAGGGLTIATALADVTAWLGVRAPGTETVEQAVSKQLALLQIAAHDSGETIDRDNLTHDQHLALIAGALADLAPAQTQPSPEQAPDYAAEGADLAADAECGLIVAQQTIATALAALRDAGKPHAPTDLRAPKLWARLVERAAQAARADD